MSKLSSRQDPIVIDSDSESNSDLFDSSSEDDDKDTKNVTKNANENTSNKNNANRNTHVSKRTNTNTNTNANANPYANNSTDSQCMSNKSNAQRKTNLNNTPVGMIRNRKGLTAKQAIESSTCSSGSSRSSSSSRRSSRRSSSSSSSGTKAVLPTIALLSKRGYDVNSDDKSTIQSTIQRTSTQQSQQQHRGQKEARSEQDLFVRRQQQQQQGQQNDSLNTNPERFFNSMNQGDTTSGIRHTNRNQIAMKQKKLQFTPKKLLQQQQQQQQEISSPLSPLSSKKQKKLQFTPTTLLRQKQQQQEIPSPLSPLSSKKQKKLQFTPKKLLQQTKSNTSTTTTPPTTASKLTSKATSKSNESSATSAAVQKTSNNDNIIDLCSSSSDDDTDSDDSSDDSSDDININIEKQNKKTYAPKLSPKLNLSLSQSLRKEHEKDHVRIRIQHDDKEHDHEKEHVNDNQKKSSTVIEKADDNKNDNKSNKKKDVLVTNVSTSTSQKEKTGRDNVIIGKQPSIVNKGDVDTKVNVNESEEDKVVEEDEDLVAVTDILEDAEIGEESNSEGEIAPVAEEGEIAPVAEEGEIAPVAEEGEIAPVADEGEMGPSWLIDDEGEDAFEDDDDFFFDAKMTNDDSDSLPVRDNDNNNDNDGENEADELHNCFETDGDATDAPISDSNGVKLRPQHEITATSDTSYAPATKTTNDNKSDYDHPHLPKEGISKSLDGKQPTRSPRSNVENSINTNIKQKKRKKKNTNSEEKPLFSQMVEKLQKNAQQCLLHDGGTHVQPKPHQSNILGPRLGQLNAKRKKKKRRKKNSNSTESTNNHNIVPATTKKSGSQTPSLQLNEKKTSNSKKKTLVAKVSSLKSRTASINQSGSSSKNKINTTKTSNLSCPCAENSDNHESQSDVTDSISFDINPKQEICWSCGTALQFNDTEEEDKGQNLSINHFFTHQHPLLKVSTCAPCADKAYAVEDDLQKLLDIKDKKSETELENDEIYYFDRESLEMEVCSWCADENKSNLLLCDDCPRVFCERCIATAHGGGMKASNVVKSLRVDDCGHWSCISCAPTPALLEMKQWLLDRVGGKEAEETNSMICDDDNGIIAQELNNKSVENLLNELTVAEDMKDEAEGMLEEKSQQQQWDQIRSEIEAKHLSEEVTNELVDNEFNSWKELWTDQHNRNSDTIGILMDLLEQKNVDLRFFYEERRPENKDDEDASLKWKETADAELNKRDGELKNKNYYLGASGWVEADDREIEDLSRTELNEIEEINTTAGTIACLTTIAEKKNQLGIIDYFSNKALPNDDAQLAHLSVNLSNRQFSERSDEEAENRIEKHGVSHQGGTSMVVTRGYERIDLKRKKADQKRKPILLNQTEVNQHTTSNSKKCRRVATQLVSMNDNDELTSERSSGKYMCFDNDICTLATIPSVYQCPVREYEGKTIGVARPIAEMLKIHQKNGIRFMWNKVCADLIPGVTIAKDEPKVKGCILAHNMGLGKSLQVIALVHTLLNHPLLEQKGQRIVKRILLLAPVNTLANWKAEFKKWIAKNKLPTFPLYDFNSVTVSGRSSFIENWYSNGGVLYCSYLTFARMFNTENIYKTYLQSPGPDLVVLDEAHLMLKNNKSEISKALSIMKAPRRIALSGTPLQNDLFEYYRMAEWIKPGCLSNSEYEFERHYVKKIMSSLTSDATKSDQLKGEELLKDLHGKLTPFVHRLDSSVLEKDLNFIQQAVIHVRPSKMQLRLYRAFKKYSKQKGVTNFLYQYSKLFPVSNHPGCLVTPKLNGHTVNNTTNKSTSTADTKGMKSYDPIISQPCGKSAQCAPHPENDIIYLLDDSDEEDDLFNASINEDAKKASTSSSGKPNKEAWWANIFKKYPTMSNLTNGGKIVLLIQILAHADMIGDKVVVFSQCLKTLNFIEKVLQAPDWSSQVPSIANLSPGRIWGNWRKDIDYLRIDGSISAKDRGDLVDQFNDKHEESISSSGLVESVVSTVKVFLISSRAGNVGINLVAANRVILFDSHWNPAMDLQALYRCYRYGQEKPVYAYRFLTEGTMEEKVYSRSVNKTSLAARIIDQKDPQRNFSSRDLQSIMEIDNWVKCEKCEKWRMLSPQVAVEDLPDQWYCEMNVEDKPRSSCKAEEKDVIFYNSLFHGQTMGSKGYEINNQESSNQENVREEGTSDQPLEDKEKTDNTKRDVILETLLKVPGSAPISKKDKSSSTLLISKYYFHDSLLKESSTIQL